METECYAVTLQNRLQVRIAEATLRSLKVERTVECQNNAGYIYHGNLVLRDHPKDESYAVYMTGGSLMQEDQLEKLLDSCGNKVVAIDFWATWCGPCKIIGPVFERLARDPLLSEKIEFVKVDVDEASDIAEWVGIECMPTFVFYKNGEKIDEMAGANTKALETMVNKYAKL